ncbi:aspartyl-phosphate phosphatase Spo0E family protein [Clostridium sp. CCUG 7971]|uniref:aspartyl-phosphate phosphatase Spo0E family protein n=1 Tax=Clostridium sp. CCUG 7971 TaxID=2811414 RepID=UPI001ABA9B42|nr:aspartyl-phosphate phosphatase Spo0E family protein [Clostridium sp. CCUG 7971]MBO3445120.1 Spo0E family sporulation regulatory protein-aspartic acid phosphatase [Clostridium sp. CCUG 7971]
MSIMDDIKKLKAKLEFEIEQYDLAKLTHNNIVGISQELDELIIEYMQIESDDLYRKNKMETSNS